MQFDLGDQPKARFLVWTNETALGLAVIAGAAATSVRVRDATGYAIGSVIVIDPGTKDEEQRTLTAVSGLTLTFVSALIYSHGLDTRVGKLADATTALILKSPDPDEAVESLGAFDAVSTGTYQKTGLAPDLAGVWWAQGAASGAVTAVAETSFTVRPSQVP